MFWFCESDSDSSGAVRDGAESNDTDFVRNAYDGGLHDDPYHRNDRNEFELLAVGGLQQRYGLCRRRQWLAI